MAEQQVEELAPSQLGTLEYWEQAYSKEIQNFQDHGDVGEIWFGDGSSKKMIRFINTKLNLPKDASIIDLGCGNGMSLVDFFNLEYKNLTGVDYSPKAIELAKTVLEEENCSGIKLQVHDILTKKSKSQDFTFQLAYDKGTYDAISLCPDEAQEKRKRYIENVKDLLVDGGFLAITSCNWTKHELVDHMKEYFVLAHELPTKAFSFGGQTGNRITQLIFVKN